MKKIFVLSFMLMFALIVSAQQRRGGMMSEEAMAQMYEEMKKELSLTDKQFEDVKAIYTDYYTKMREQRESAGGDREKMRELMTSLGEKRNEKIKEVLTAEQFTKYEKMEADRRQRGPGGGGGRPN